MPKQKREAYKKLSPEVQGFVMDNETTDLISQYLKEAGLSEDQAEQVDSEILYAMLGLQTFEVTKNNIAKISGKSVDDLRDLKKKLDENIFSKIPRSKISQPEPKLRQPQPPKMQNHIGDSFEQAIVNQARAIQPARHASQGDAGGPAREAPSNLPTGEQVKNQTSSDNQERKVHNHAPGTDPYREPPA